MNLLKLYKCSNILIRKLICNNKFNLLIIAFNYNIFSIIGNLIGDQKLYKKEFVQTKKYYKIRIFYFSCI